jgi:hypothetical protein
MPVKSKRKELRQLRTQDELLRRWKTYGAHIGAGVQVMWANNRLIHAQLGSPEIWKIIDGIEPNELLAYGYGLFTICAGFIPIKEGRNAYMTTIQETPNMTIMDSGAHDGIAAALAARRFG